METTPASLFIPLSLCFIAGVFSLFIYFNSSVNNDASNKAEKLPPGPPAVPGLGTIPWFLLRRMFRSGEAKDRIRELHVRYGPIVTIRFGSFLVVLVAGPILAHEALVELGAAFADRYRLPPVLRFLHDGLHRISTEAYGPTWRRLRLNLVGNVLHPDRVALFAEARAWALKLLVRRLIQQSGGGPIVVRESFRFGLYALLLFMCFGEKLEEKVIEEIIDAERSLMLFSSSKLYVFAFAPSITKRVFWHRRRAAAEMLGKRRELLVPLIKARRENRAKPGERPESYVDSLLDLELEAEGMRKKLGEDDIVALCGEFLDAGTETTAAALEWIMANLVKHGDVQAKLLEEMEAVGGGRRVDIAEEDLERMPYLDSVIKEGLRRHPPAKSLIPHTATADGATLGGYWIPKTAQIVFEAAGVGWEEAWEDAEAFRPERWDGEGVESALSGREMRMMPFGLGRRACPAVGLAMLHLRYFVANLVWKWQWKAELEEVVDMAEKVEFVTVMKNPLKARLVLRSAAPPPCESTNEPDEGHALH